MFVKKLVEKAIKKPGGSLNSLKSDDVNPRIVFHYGIPAGSIALAYDSIQKILAISTKDGRIKLLGKDNTQALLQSPDAVPSKFLQFFENQGILLNVTVENHIEVWDINRKQLSHIHLYKGDITCFMAVQHSFFIYVGEALGNILVLKLDKDTHHLISMKYNIPPSASLGNTTETVNDNAVIYIMPQPMAESKRILIVFRSGTITLWGLEESKIIFVTGGNIQNSLTHEAKKVNSACWACPFGSKIAVGYSNGEIYLWSVPPFSNQKSASAAIKESSAASSVPIYKLNLSYKVEKSPILSLKWVYGDGKASRLYVNGHCSSASSNLLQIVLLNEHMETRIIKFALPLPEPCLDMEIISSSSEQNKQKQDSLLVVLKSGHLCIYDDFVIEKYLLQCQSRSPPSLPKQINVKLPFVDSSITVSQFITNDLNVFGATDEDYDLLAKNFSPLLSVEAKVKDENYMNSAQFNGFAGIKCLYITGHIDGTIHLWDLSCPLLFPISLVKYQSEDGHSITGIPVTALYFDVASQILVSGHQSGVIRIFKIKSELFSAGISKKGSNHIIQSVKLVKVNGAVLSINMNHGTRHLAVGCDQGYVALIDIEGPSVLFQQHIRTELSAGVISLQFETCSFHGFEKNVLLVASKDSSVLALEVNTGNILSTTVVCPKRPSRALFMQILDVSDGADLSKQHDVRDTVAKKSLLLLCNEKAVYIYSLIHAAQGIKKVQYKKKFHGTSCCWASTFGNNGSDVALVLLFTSGKIEVRSLPELFILKETSIRGLTLSNPHSDISICSSCDGEIVLVKGDQEVFFISLLLQKEIYRILDSVGQVFKKGVTPLQDAFFFDPKEKKKGIFTSVIKDIKGNKEKQCPDTEADDSRTSVGEEFSAIFSTANFPSKSNNTDHLVVDEREVELSIDDIDLEDPEEKSKGRGNMIPALNKHKLSSKFQAIKGKLKQKVVKNEKESAKTEPEDIKMGAVDLIKKKYGFPLHGESDAGRIAENKLRENVGKLKDINTRATEMQNTAQSFSALAKQLLRTAEQDKRLL